MGRPGQPGVQGGRPQRTGAPLGKPQGEHPWSARFTLTGEMNTQVERQPQALDNVRCLFFFRTETTWPMRKCPVLCGTTTSSTSSKRSEDKNSSSGLYHLRFVTLLLSFPHSNTHVYCYCLFSASPSGFWSSHRTTGNCRPTPPSPQTALCLRTGIYQTAVLHTSSVRTILRFPLIVFPHSLLHRNNKITHACTGLTKCTVRCIVRNVCTVKLLFILLWINVCITVIRINTNTKGGIHINIQPSGLKFLNITAIQKMHLFPYTKCQYRVVRMTVKMFVLWLFFSTSRRGVC